MWHGLLLKSLAQRARPRKTCGQRRANPPLWRVGLDEPFSVEHQSLERLPTRPITETAWQSKRNASVYACSRCDMHFDRRCDWRMEPRSRHSSQAKRTYRCRNSTNAYPYPRDLRRHITAKYQEVNAERELVTASTKVLFGRQRGMEDTIELCSAALFEVLERPWYYLLWQW